MAKKKRKGKKVKKRPVRRKAKKKKVAKRKAVKKKAAKRKAVKKKRPAAKKEDIEPKLFTELIGVKEGDIIVCLHCKEQFLSKLRNQLPRYARVYPTIREGKPPSVFIRFFNDLADFDASFRWLQKQLVEGGCIWGVIPKKNALKKGQRYLRDEMIKHARRNDLTDSKTVTFSLTENGIKFVRKKR